MKSTNFFIYFLIVLFSVGTVSAIIFPLPINGRIDSTNVQYQKVEITNQRTGVTVQTETNTNGEYLYDWANSDDKGGTISRYAKGDQFLIKILGCSAYASNCIKTLTYTGQPEIFQVWDLSSITLSQQCPAPTTCPACSCGGGSSVIYTCTEEQARKIVNCSEVEYLPEECPTTECPVVDCSTVIDHTPYESCDSCCTAETCEETICETCDEQNNDLLGIIAGIAAFILTLGGGMQIYRNRKGGITLLHRHRGIRGYHNPDTQHRNPKYKHAKLTTSPAQYAKDIKKIEETGGLI